MHANRTALRLPPAFLLLASLAAAPLPAQEQPPAAAAAAPAAAAGSDQQAHRIASQVMEALGGRSAWDSTRYLRFTFAGRRSHLWDKATGRHRVEGQDRDGKRFVVLENLNTRQGRAWVDGQEATGEKLQQMLELGYGTWVNDTYWLLMPYKMEDPGVHLTYAGEETIDGRTYDKLHLSFEKVGLTPGDEYWAYIDRNTHLMDRWAYHLESMKPEEPPTAWLWQGWQRFGKIQLAPHRVQVGQPDRKLELSDIAVADSMPETAFTSPAPLPAP
jgi:hypothetical protein